MTLAQQEAQQVADRSPVVAFGLHASTAALKAKSGVLSMRDKLALTVALIEWVPDHAELRDAVVEFIRLAERDGRAAGEHLQQALDLWLADPTHRQSEAVLEGLGLLRDPAGRVAPDWTSRKDCGHD